MKHHLRGGPADGKIFETPEHRIENVLQYPPEPPSPIVGWYKRVGKVADGVYLYDWVEE